MTATAAKGRAAGPQGDFDEPFATALSAARGAPDVRLGRRHDVLPRTTRVFRSYLDTHAGRTPRTMLVYATEHLDAALRARHWAAPRD